jgi:CheY-like chemotaxis protein
VRVLLIDDSRDTTMVLSRLLARKCGFVVQAVEDATVAVAVATDFRPDAICLDIGMPVIDGYQLASAIRQVPGLGRIAIVALSGYPPNEEKDRAAGIDAHLLKPADYRLIESAIVDSIKIRS